MRAAEHPGIILKERFLDPLGITPYRLAKDLGVHITRVSRIVRGERGITADTAARLGLYFDVPPIWWLQMQAEYELTHEVDLEVLDLEVNRLVRPPNCAIGPGGVRHFRVAPDQTSTPASAQVSESLLQRLREQAQHREEGGTRTFGTVDYGNGYRAIVGSKR